MGGGGCLKIWIVGTRLNRLNEAILTSTNNLCFRAKIRKCDPFKPLFYNIKTVKGDMNYTGVIMMNIVNDRWFEFISRCCTMNVPIYHIDNVSICHKDNVSIFHKMMCHFTI